MGSMENFVKRGGTAKVEKLWLDVSPVSSIHSIKNTNNAGHNIRPTVTTLLRHHQILEKKSKEEEEKVLGFVQGNSDFDYDNWRHTKEAEEKKQTQLNKTKRILKAKLSYHKAIAATQQVANEKSEQGRELRDETRKLKEETELERRVELERRKMFAAEIQEDQQHVRQTALDLIEEKKRQAKILKDEKWRMQQESRRKSYQEFMERKEKIEQLQAWKQAQRTVNSGHWNANGSFVSALGCPHSEIELKLSKERKLEELEERRNKVAELKAEKERRLNEMKNKLEQQCIAHTDSRKLHQKFAKLPEWRLPRVDMEDMEVVALAKELQRYQQTTPSKYAR